MPKCCLYCRVDGASTESNRLAMNQQLTALRSLAGQLGFSISAEMLQYESGLDANRQSIRTLIRDARHGVYDRVLVMKSGRIVEQGSHSVLSTAGGLYARMWADYNQAVQWKITSEREVE